MPLLSIQPAKQQFKSSIFEPIVTWQINRFNNQLVNLGLLPVPGRDTIKSFERINVQQKKEIKQLEQKLQLLLE